jgi:hypothetical protein
MKYNLIVMIVLWLAIPARAQILPTPPSNVEVVLENVVSSSTASLFDTSSFNINSLVFQAKLLVEVVDYTNVSKIHIKLGTSSGASDLIQHVFTTDPLQMVPLYFSYSYENNLYTLEVGQYTGLTTYYCEVQLEYSDGQFSLPTLYSSE